MKVKKDVLLILFITIILFCGNTYASQANLSEDIFPYEEDFTVQSPNNKWKDNFHYKFESGCYQIKTKRIKQKTKAQIPIDNVGYYYSAEVEVNKEKGTAHYGIVFNEINGTPYYFKLNPIRGKYALTKDGEVIINWTQSDFIKTGKAINKIKLQQVGSLLMLYVNDKLLNQVKINVNFKNSNKLYLTALSVISSPAKVYFDNLKITQEFDIPYQDTFNTINTAWKVDYTWDYQDSAYGVKTFTPLLHKSKIPVDIENKDYYTVEAQMKLRKGQDGFYGFLFNQIDKDQYYYFKVNPVKKKYIIEHIDGVDLEGNINRNILKETSSKYINNKINNLKIEYNSPTYKFYINNQLIRFEHTINPEQNKQYNIALAASEFRSISKILFDNIKVKGLSERKFFNKLLLTDNSYLYLYNSRNNNLKNLGIYSRDATFSPDGKMISYIANEKNGYNVYRKNINSTKSKELVSSWKYSGKNYNNYLNYFSDINWSFSQNKIGFLGDLAIKGTEYKDNFKELIVVELNKNLPLTYLISGLDDNTSLEWFKDKNKIIYSEKNKNKYQLVKFNLKTREKNIIGNEDEIYKSIDLSANEEKVIYENKEGIFIIDLVNGKRRLLAPSGSKSPKWAEDDMIIYISKHNKLVLLNSNNRSNSKINLDSFSSNYRILDILSK